MTGGGPVLRPSEHPFGIGRRRFRDLFRGQSLDLGDFFADVTHPGRFVALAPVRRGRQIGTVGFEHEVPQLHFARDLGQPALFKAIRQDAAQKADKLKTERMQKAKADLAAAKQSAETAAAAEQRTAQQKTAALAEDIRKKAQQNSANVIRAIREAITG